MMIETNKRIAVIISVVALLLTIGLGLVYVVVRPEPSLQIAWIALTASIVSLVFAYGVWRQLKSDLHSKDREDYLRSH